MSVENRPNQFEIKIKLRLENRRLICFYNVQWADTAKTNRTKLNQKLKEKTSRIILFST